MIFFIFIFMIYLLYQIYSFVYISQAFKVACIIIFALVSLLLL